MAMDGCDAGGSVTRWIGPLKAGEVEAAQALWDRYFDGLVRLARTRLRDAPRAVADEEDVALSAIHCLCRGAAAGRFPQLADRGNLWRLLATIAAQKAVDLQRREAREKRGGGKMLGEGELAGDNPEANVAALVVGREPSPEFAAQLDEEYRRQLERLEDDGLRQIAVWKMEGYDNDEIALRLGCGVRTVERKLGVIRAIWQADRPA
jgi:DNA-directed RNA polymerase specialized sigma24 family protein